MILIGYDGSDDAKAAIAHVAAMCPGATAHVLTVWERFTTMLARTPASIAPLAGIPDVGEWDAAAERSAQQCAREGAELARAAGLDASAITIARHRSTADAILDEADRLDVDEIVVGSRGLTGVGSLLLGSVSHPVVQHADRTVLVVPAPGVAERRRHRRHVDQKAVEQTAA